MSSYDTAAHDPSPKDQQFAAERDARKQKEVESLKFLKGLVSTSGSPGHEVSSLTKEGFALATIKPDVIEALKKSALSEYNANLAPSVLWRQIVEKVQQALDTRGKPPFVDFDRKQTDAESLSERIAEEIVKLFDGKTSYSSSVDWIDREDHQKLAEKVRGLFPHASTSEARPTIEQAESESFASKVAANYVHHSYDDFPEDRAYEKEFFAGELNKLLLDQNELPSTDNVTILVLPGVGRNSQSEDVRACVDHLQSKKIDTLAIDWPKFESYEQLALWLKVKIDELKAAGLIKDRLIIYGHSKGGLAARVFADLYPDMVESIIESGVPACSEDDPRPKALEDTLQRVLDNPVVVNILNFLAEKGVKKNDELIHYILENPGEAAMMYLGHIRSGKMWDAMARRFPASKSLYSYHRKGDTAVNYVGRSSVYKIPFAVVMESNAKGHKMLPPYVVEKITLHALARAEKRKKAFDPARLIFEDEET